MSAQPAPNASNPPAGWHKDPAGTPNLRWWDGEQWTEHTHADATAPARDMGADPAMRMLLPVGRSGWAIASGYLGLFAFIGIGAPFAIITGLLAIRDMRKHPEKHGMGRAIFGITVGTLAMIGYGLLFATSG